MTDDDAGVPDTDPEHIDPAGDIARAVESGEFDIQLAEDQSREELEEFVRKAEAREYDDDTHIDRTIRVVRAILGDESDS